MKRLRHVLMLVIVGLALNGCETLFQPEETKIDVRVILSVCSAQSPSCMSLGLPEVEVVVRSSSRVVGTAKTDRHGTAVLRISEQHASVLQVEARSRMLSKPLRSDVSVENGGSATVGFNDPEPLQR